MINNDTLSSWDQSLERVNKSLDKVALWTMMIIAAPTIAGKHCIIKRRDPTMKGAAAEVSVNQDGVPVASISPNLGDHTIITYLHELAHIRLGHTDKMARSNTHQEAPGSDNLRVNTSWENSVDDQVNAWLRYGRDHADPGDQLGIIDAIYKYYQNH